MIKFIFLIALVLIFIPIIRVLRTVSKFENEGKYKEAVYEYAHIVVLGTTTASYYRKRIKKLWKEYGPFDYADFLEKFTKIDDEENRVHYDAVLRVIKESI